MDFFFYFGESMLELPAMSRLFATLLAVRVTDSDSGTTMLNIGAVVDTMSHHGVNSGGSLG